MKERPIIFSAPMVRAILAETKTQTRRVVKITHKTPGLAACLEPFDPAEARPKVAAELCRYGVPGDRLWVRETWAAYDQQSINDREREGIFYRANDAKVYDSDGAWRSSMFMPRWASRITLEVTGIRVQRLQDISEADAIAEGIEQVDKADDGKPLWRLYGREPWNTVSARTSYQSLWDSINAKRAPWSSNSWVWVIAFRRIAASDSA